MSDFLIFFNDAVKRYPMHMEIWYSKTLDWIIEIYKKGCDDSVPGTEIVSVQGLDMQLVFAQAHVELKKFLTETEGGY